MHAQFFLVLLIVCVASLTGCDSAAPPLDPDRLEQVEDLSESLANDLLELSVATQRREMTRIGSFFADRVTAVPFPTEPASLEPRVKWIRAHGWPTASGAHEMPRDEFLTAWDGFFDHFSSVEDVRFKVKGATFASERAGRARVFLYIIGRDHEDRREWVSAWFDLAADRDEDHPPSSNVDDSERTPTWRIRELVLESVESMVATEDIFSEVSMPAGVARTLPRFGTPGNEGFVWHGGAAADVDLDGDIDLATTGNAENFLYLNDGHGRFVEAAEAAGIRYLPEVGVAPLFVDFDNDGDQDLFISAVGTQMLFENRLIPGGTLGFLDVSLPSGVSVPAVGFSAVAGDVNGDGLPDIFVASYNHYGRIMPNAWDNASNGTPNRLFLNRGNGRFEEAAGAWGIDDSRWSYAAQLVDIDSDGDLDAYVANDFGENGLFRNDGDHFTDVAAELAVSDPGNGMGVSFGDYDNDGDLDLHVTNMSSTAGNRILSRLYPDADPTGGVLRKLAAGNSLYEHLADGSWKDVTREVGGFGAGWAWGGGFVDFDNDGWEDTYTPNGFVSGKSMKDT